MRMEEPPPWQPEDWVPRQVQTMPELWWHLQEVWEAFWQLSHCRPVTMAGPGAITFTDLAAYLRVFGDDDREEQQWFVSLIQAMDGTFLQFYARKHQTTQATHQGTLNGVGRP